MLSISALLGKSLSGYLPAVPRSAEFLRIFNLPCRTLDRAALVGPWTSALRSDTGKRQLFPDQAAALYEVSQVGSAIVALRPGAGKTTIGALAATVCNAKRPLYLCDASAKDQVIKDDLPVLRAHWKVPMHLTVWSYQELSSKQGRARLFAYQPDLIAADEAQKLKNEDSARTARFLSYFEEFPETKFIPMSGSFTVKELTELYHLFRAGLGIRSPVPIILDEAQAWSDALGSSVEDRNRLGLGALTLLTEFLEPHERNGDQLTQARRGFRRRMELTAGVVLSARDQIKLPLTIKQPQVEVPSKVVAAFKHLHDAWELGDEEFTDRVEFAGAARTLICGFYYRWVWPDGKKNEAWIDARKAWHKYVRNKVLYDETHVGLDTKGLVEDACKYHEAYQLVKDDPAQRELAKKLEDVVKLDSPQYRAWCAIAHEYKIVKEAVWLDEYLIDFACDWMQRNNGLVWVPYVAIGDRLKARGVRYFGGGDNGITHYRQACAASIASHHTSKNLQHWHKCLYLLPPGNGSLAEQSLARQHRYGQEHPVVAEMVISCRASWDAWEQALKDAKYAQDINSDQLLCAADLSGVMKGPPKNSERDPLWLV